MKKWGWSWTSKGLKTQTENSREWSASQELDKGLSTQQASHPHRPFHERTSAPLAQASGQRAPASRWHGAGTVQAALDDSGASAWVGGLSGALSTSFHMGFIESPRGLSVKSSPEWH